MVEINQGYYHSMDREYEMLNNLQSENRASKNMSKPLLSIEEIGTSVTEGKPVQGQRLRQTVTAAMGRGVKEIELSMQASNVFEGPGSYSPEEREELREMARINQVRFTSTHVSPGTVGNLSGLGQRGFSEQERQRQLGEIREAIQFAGETALGGAIVVHTGEFPRSISKADKDGTLFSEFAGEEGKKERVHHLIDKKTGQIIQTVREDQVNYDFYYEGLNGEMVTDEKLAKTETIAGEKVPKLYVNEKGEYESFKKTWNYYENQAHKIQKETGKNIDPGKLFFDETLKTQMQKANSQSLDYQSRYFEAKEGADKVKEEINKIKEYIKTYPASEELERIEDQISKIIFIPESEKGNKDLILKRLDQQIKNNERKVESFKEATMSSQRNIKELERVQETTDSISNYAKNKSINSLASLGIDAMKETQKAEAKFGKIQKVRDIFIAPENIFAEMGHGSHPDELIELVQESRKSMAERLHKEQNIEMSEAEKLANRHIKSTLDTEHLGMWKRYFQKKPGESEEKFDKRFEKWYLEQIKKLGEADVVGHVHIADTFGYSQSQLPAGHGAMPLYDAIKYLKEKGYKGTFESEGWGDPVKQETSAWSYFGSPIYSIKSSKPVQFGQVHQGYFASRSPYRNVTPPYYPSEDWQLWSEVPLD